MRGDMTSSDTNDYQRTRILDVSAATAINGCQIHVPRIARRIDNNGVLQRSAKLRVHTSDGSYCTSWVTPGDELVIGDPASDAQRWIVAGIRSCPGVVGAVVLGLPMEGL